VNIATGTSSSQIDVFAQRRTVLVVLAQQMAGRVVDKMDLTGLINHPDATHQVLRELAQALAVGVVAITHGLGAAGQRDQAGAAVQVIAVGRAGFIRQGLAGGQLGQIHRRVAQRLEAVAFGCARAGEHLFYDTQSLQNKQRELRKQHVHISDQQGKYRDGKQVTSNKLPRPKGQGIRRFASRRPAGTVL
jgi:hypothetical protein